MRSRAVLAAWIGAAVAALGWSSQASAAPRSCRGDADALFRCGKELLDAGHLADACAALAASQAAEPGVGTLGLLATCHEKQGRLATAHGEFEAAARLARERGDARERFALERATLLLPRVPRLVVRPASGEAPVVRVGRRELAASELGGELLLDPGELEVTAALDGDAWSTVVRLVADERRTVDIPRFVESTPPSAGLPPGTWAGLAVSAVGFATMGVSGAIAISADGASAGYEAPCAGGDLVACEAGSDARSDATTAAHVATGGLVVGALGLGVAAVVWLVDDEGPAAIEAGAQGSRFVLRF